MPDYKKERGRPLGRKYPPTIDATAEEIAQAMFSLPQTINGSTSNLRRNTVAPTVGARSTTPTRCTAVGGWLGFDIIPQR